MEFRPIQGDARNGGTIEQAANVEKSLVLAATVGATGNVFPQSGNFWTLLAVDQ
jgi:hypothetical protein